MSSPLPLPAERGPYLGPETGDVLDARQLADLERRALEHSANALTQAFPILPYTGPRTGETVVLEGPAATGRQTAAPPVRAEVTRRRRQRLAAPRFNWPLLAVLAVQAVLSLRLVWSNTAFTDEALYLWAGHLELAHWLHGAPVPAFQTYFSGAPVIYPPLGAIADALGGLAAARLLSAAFTLGTSALLWGTAGRLYGRRAAYLSTTLFAGLTGTQFLGALATYDAMALFLLAAAAYLGTRAAASRYWPALAVAAGVILAAANATKYATGIFDPAVAAVVAGEGLRQRRGAGRALWPALSLTAAAAASVAAAVLAGGHSYWLGLASTTLARPAAVSAPDDVVKWAWVWTGPVVLLACCAVLMSLKGGWRCWAIPVILLAAGALAPAEQARIHTMTSLNKHVVFGAWFAAIGAGYALSRISLVDRSRIWAFVLTMPVAGMVLFGTYGQAGGMHHAWPDTSAIMAELRPVVQSHPGIYLAEDPEVDEYYLRAVSTWEQWRGTYPQDNDGAAYYRETISHHYFALIILANSGATKAADHLIITDIYAAGGYRVVARADGYVAWAAERS